MKGTAPRRWLGTHTPDCGPMPGAASSTQLTAAGKPEPAVSEVTSRAGSGRSALTAMTRCWAPSRGGLEWAGLCARPTHPPDGRRPPEGSCGKPETRGRTATTTGRRCRQAVQRAEAEERAQARPTQCCGTASPAGAKWRQWAEAVPGRVDAPSRGPCGSPTPVCDSSTGAQGRANHASPCAGPSQAGWGTQTADTDTRTTGRNQPASDRASRPAAEKRRQRPAARCAGAQAGGRGRGTPGWAQVTAGPRAADTGGQGVGERSPGAPVPVEVVRGPTAAGGHQRHHAQANQRV